MLVPSSLTLSTMVLKTKGCNSYVSYTYTATFADGTQKMLNRKAWVLSSLIRHCDIDEVHLFKENCTLFFKDWSKNPTFGLWDKHYPKPIIPTEVLECI